MKAQRNRNGDSEPQSAPAVGRELDITIGKHIFGHRFCDSTSALELPARCSLYGEPHYPSDGGEHLPHYSTDIAAAWLVVERLVNRGAKVSLTNRYSPTVWGCHVILKVGRPEEHSHYRTSEEGAPLAICLAALAAVDGAK